MKQTTIRVSPTEKQALTESANLAGMALCHYIPYTLNEKLPVSQIKKHIRGGKESVRIGFYIHDDIIKKMNKNLKAYTDRFHKYTAQDLILTVLLGEVEG